MNQGREDHHLVLMRLSDGKTAADLSAALRQEGPLPSWATLAGGPNGAAPGATAQATVALAPGSYILMCVMPTADGTPHMAKGMVAPLTVTPRTTAAVAEPTADVKLSLSDYAFDVPGPLTVGTHTLRVDNNGTQPHEAFLVRLAPGKSATDLLAWYDKMQGPPSGESFGGITPIEVGGHAYFTDDFTAGHYALFCFVPDAKDGKPHIAHGMIKEFTVT